MRRVFGDAMISLCALLLLLLLLVTIDPRVRDQVSTVWMSPGSSVVNSVSHQMREMSSIVVDAARDHSIDQAPLMLFALAATVLVLFMLRT
jgi:hypothetical protein